MELLDTFETISELAIALTGFTGVVVVLGRRSLDEWTDDERFSLKALLYWSLGTMFLALVPSGLYSLGDAVPAPWRVAHGLFAIFHGGVFIWFFRQLRAMQRSWWSVFQSKTGPTIVTIGFGLLIAEIAVAFGALLAVAPFLYLVALVWFLFLAARSFVTLIFPSLRADPPAA